jgi:2-polyprenyl-6-methoxyphenol hydroxylase-like FAD-dependent oxidoreductase
LATHLRRAAPALARRLTQARQISPVRGTLRSPNVLRRPYGHGWALVGDAAYHRDAVSAHGLSDAYRDAELLAVALDRALRGDTDELSALCGYQRSRDHALREIFDITSALSTYPPVPAFTDLMRRLSAAIDVEASDLAARPVPATMSVSRCTPPGERGIVPASTKENQI